MNSHQLQKQIFEANIKIPDSITSQNQNLETKNNIKANFQNSSVLLEFLNIKGIIFQAQKFNSSFCIINKKNFPKYSIS